MKNPFKTNKLTIEELSMWERNPLVNPRSGNPIKKDGKTYKIISKSFEKLKDIIHINAHLSKLMECVEDRDPISMNVFWTTNNDVKTIVYPIESMSQLVFYQDNNKLLHCMETKSLEYLKSYGILHNPVTMEPIPSSVFDNIKSIELDLSENINTVENIAFDVFQYFTKISIFIDYEWFLSLEKNQLIKLNYELGDFWEQNFTHEQKQKISSKSMFEKKNDILSDYNIVEIQKYLLDEMKILLECGEEDYKYMINYVILGALSIVIPKIKNLYPDFSFSFC